MPNTTRLTESYTPPKDLATVGNGVRLVNPSTPGYRYGGRYTMVFSCTPELCGCTADSPARSGQPGFLEDAAPSDFADAPPEWKSGVRPLFDIPSGEMYLAAGPSDANDVILTWEWELLYDLREEVFDVPLCGRVLAVGRPGMADFVLLSHVADVAFAYALDQLTVLHTILTM